MFPLREKKENLHVCWWCKKKFTPKNDWETVYLPYSRSDKDIVVTDQNDLFYGMTGAEVEKMLSEPGKLVRISFIRNDKNINLSPSRRASSGRENDKKWPANISGNVSNSLSHRIGIGDTIGFYNTHYFLHSHCVWPWIKKDREGEMRRILAQVGFCRAQILKLTKPLRYGKNQFNPSFSVVTEVGDFKIGMCEWGVFLDLDGLIIPQEKLFAVVLFMNKAGKPANTSYWHKHTLHYGEVVAFLKGIYERL
ncbi:MAG: hypothetical protein NUV82_01000 [Candidatus Komeilibacteria bacterium]|nr:hypothetical protein [Candidatus Komeilibacteria bacterium]